MELQDIDIPYACDDGTLTEDTLIHSLGQLAYKASVALNRSLHVAPTYKDLLAKAGFIDIVERQFKWPIGIWPKDKYYKELGYWAYTNIEFGMEGLFMALFTRGLGWTKEEVLIFCAQARAGLRDTSVHAYIPM